MTPVDSGFQCHAESAAAVWAATLPFTRVSPTVPLARLDGSAFRTASATSATTSAASTTSAPEVVTTET
jgi:hypothetical protein